METLTRNFVVAVFLFSLSALSGNWATVQAQGGSWTLKEKRVFNNMDGSVATITSERYDASGGSVDLQLSGDILSFCPGGYEKLRFTWSFPDNVTSVVNGGGIGVSLDARQISKSQNCGTQLASRSVMYVYPGSFALEGDNSVDRDRFLAGNNFRVRAAEGENSGTGALKVNTHAFNSLKPMAYFEVCIGTPTRSGGGSLCYAYVYENGGSGGSNSGGGAGGLSVENDTDRMGGDYKDYDLPRADFELCRSACAGDSNCKAYTYVKPGVQGSSARCWLKSSVPAAGASSCCISGFKSQSRAFLENRRLLDWLEYKPISPFQDSE
jgi:hypothetical protein